MLLKSTTTFQQGSCCAHTAGLCPWQLTKPGTSAGQPGSPGAGLSRLMMLPTDAGVRQHLEGASACSVLTNTLIIYSCTDSALSNRLRTAVLHP